MPECDDRQIKFCTEKFGNLTEQITRLETLIRENFQSLVSGLSKLERDITHDIDVVDHAWRERVTTVENTLREDIAAVEADLHLQDTELTESNNRLRAIILGNGTEGLYTRVARCESEVESQRWFRRSVIVAVSTALISSGVWGLVHLIRMSNG